jgi:hypothetical protein
MVVTLVARNWNEVTVAPMVGRGVVCSQVVDFVLVRDLVSVALKTFSHLIYLMKHVFKCGTCKAFCSKLYRKSKQRGPFPSTLTYYTTPITRTCWYNSYCAGCSSSPLASWVGVWVWSRGPKSKATTRGLEHFLLRTKPHTRLHCYVRRSDAFPKDKCI